MTKFTKYTSLNVPKQLARIDSFAREVLYGKDKLYEDLWVAQEKIHGANFQINIELKYVSEIVEEKQKLVPYIEQVRYASRNNFVDATSSFKGYDQTRTAHEDGAIELALFIAQSKFNPFVTQIKQVCIFGEVAGNGVQRGIHYSEDVRFYGFDILLISEDDQEYFLPFLSAIELMIRFGIGTAPIIAFGQYDRVSKLSCDFKSLINQKNFISNVSNFTAIGKAVFHYKSVIDTSLGFIGEEVFEDGHDLGLHLLTQYSKSIVDIKKDGVHGHNLAEGYVLRPNINFDQRTLKALQFANILNNRYPMISRFIFKIKTSAFDEVKNTRVAPDGTLILPKEVKGLDDITCKFIKDNGSTFIKYCNENRVNAVLSKESDLTMKKFKEYMNLLIEDVIKDVADDEELVDLHTFAIAYKERDFDIERIEDWKLISSIIGKSISKTLGESLGWHLSQK